MAIPHWQAEIEQLHDSFQDYFLGRTNDLDRVELVLADDFTHVGPDADSSTRKQVIAALVAAHAHTDTLTIRTVDHRLLLEHDGLLVAEYVEEHHVTDLVNTRLSTVVFSPSESAPNGLVWRRVHETWIDHGLES